MKRNAPTSRVLPPLWPVSRVATRSRTDPDWSLLGTILELRLHHTFVVQTDKGSVLIRNRRYLKPVHWLLFFNVPVLSPASAGRGGGVGGCCRARLWCGRETWCFLLIVWARARDIHSYIFYYLSRKGFSKTICMGCEHMGCEPNWRKRRRENDRNVLVAMVVALVVVVVVEGKQ